MYTNTIKAEQSHLQPLAIKLMSVQYPRDFKESRPRPGAWPQFDQESAPDVEEFATKAAEIRQAVILEMQQEHNLLLERHQQQQDQHVDNLAQVKYSFNKSPQGPEPFTALSLLQPSYDHSKKTFACLHICMHTQAPKLLHMLHFMNAAHALQCDLVKPHVMI